MLNTSDLHSHVAFVILDVLKLQAKKFKFLQEGRALFRSSDFKGCMVAVLFLGKIIEDAFDCFWILLAEL